jgi:acyl carrier protein
VSLSKDELQNDIAGILQCPADSLVGESGLNNHPSWDSIAHIDIMMLLAERFDIEISDETIQTYAELSNILALAE